MVAPNSVFQRIFEVFNAGAVSGVIQFPSASAQSHIQTGGTFVCNGTSAVTVIDSNITANSAIIPTLKTVSGTVGALPSIKTITPGTGFTIAGTAADNSTYNYLIIG